MLNCFTFLKYRSTFDGTKSSPPSALTLKASVSMFDCEVKLVHSGSVLSIPPLKTQHSVLTASLIS